MVGPGTRTGRRTAGERRGEPWSTPTATSWHTHTAPQSFTHFNIIYQQLIIALTFYCAF